jgi:uncharacterized repeat protein (TIGR03809 family)
MTESQASRRFAEIAQKWRDLVERRCAHFIELHRTGGWKRYYDEAKILRLMSEAVALAQTWSRIAPRPQDDSDASVKTDPAPNPPRRTAASKVA